MFSRIVVRLQTILGLPKNSCVNPPQNGYDRLSAEGDPSTNLLRSNTMESQKILVNGYKFTAIPVGNTGMAMAVPEDIMAVLAGLLTGKFNLNNGLDIQRIPETEATPKQDTPEPVAPKVPSWMSGETVFHYRDRMGWSMGEMARRLNTSRRSVGRWEDGRKTMDQVMATR